MKPVQLYIADPDGRILGCGDPRVWLQEDYPLLLRHHEMGDFLIQAHFLGMDVAQDGGIPMLFRARIVRRGPAGGFEDSGSWFFPTQTGADDRLELLVATVTEAEAKGTRIDIRCLVQDKGWHRKDGEHGNQRQES